jgi:hypothetical protein
VGQKAREQFSRKAISIEGEKSNLGALFAFFTP